MNLNMVVWIIIWGDLFLVLGRIGDLGDLKAFMRAKGLRVVRKPAKDMYGYAGLTEEDGKLWKINIPHNVIWVDATLRGRYYFEILRHEVEELMLVRGGSAMWDAHKEATRHEKR